MEDQTGAIAWFWIKVVPGSMDIAVEIVAESALYIVRADVVHGKARILCPLGGWEAGFFLPHRVLFCVAESVSDGRPCLKGIFLDTEDRREVIAWFPAVILPRHVFYTSDCDGAFANTVAVSRRSWSPSIVTVNHIQG